MFKKILFGTLVAIMLAIPAKVEAAACDHEDAYEILNLMNGQSHDLTYIYNVVRAYMHAECSYDQVIQAEAAFSEYLGFWGGFIFVCDTSCRWDWWWNYFATRTQGWP